MDLVGGIDGCRGGWVLVTTPARRTGRSTVTVIADVKEAVALLDARWLAAAGIDIPIGLPDHGTRRCDVEARRLAGRRSSSVFPAPMRGLLGAEDYQQACERSREHSGRAVSRQTFSLLPKIGEVDHMAVPWRQRFLVEVHPEVSFAQLAGAPMAHSKRRSEGRLERIEALRRSFPDVDRHVRRRPPAVGPDDVLDAFAAAWSARRWVTGTFVRLGGDERDQRGLRMQIIA